MSRETWRPEDLMPREEREHLARVRLYLEAGGVAPARIDQWIRDRAWYESRYEATGRLLAQADRELRDQGETALDVEQLTRQRAQWRQLADEIDTYLNVGPTAPDETEVALF